MTTTTSEELARRLAAFEVENHSWSETLDLRHAAIHLLDRLDALPAPVAVDQHGAGKAVLATLGYRRCGSGKIVTEQRTNLGVYEDRKRFADEKIIFTTSRLKLQVRDYDVDGRVEWLTERPWREPQVWLAKDRFDLLAPLWRTPESPVPLVLIELPYNDPDIDLAGHLDALLHLRKKWRFLTESKYALRIWTDWRERLGGPNWKPEANRG